MGFLEAAKGNWPLEAHVTETVKRARKAWEGGQPVFVWRQDATSRFNEAWLAQGLGEILEMGWKIEAMSSHFNTVALNAEVVLFVFTRS